ncbi:MAG: hypothetical protein ACTSRG_15410 [Candidatus Helarchaeota archaeon]
MKKKDEMKNFSLSKKRIMQIAEETAQELISSSEPPIFKEFKDVLREIVFQRLKDFIHNKNLNENTIKIEITKVVEEFWRLNEKKIASELKNGSVKKKQEGKKSEITHVDYSKLPDVSSNPAIHLEYMKSQEFVEDQELRKYVDIQIRDLKKSEVIAKKREIKDKIDKIRDRAKKLRMEKEKFEQLLKYPQIYTEKIELKQLPRNEFFKLIIKQIENLDYLQLMVDEENLKLQYGAYVHPLETKIVFEIAIEKNILIFKIFANVTENITQFKERLTRIIKFSIDYTEKIQISTNLIYINIKNAFNIIYELIGLFDLCNEGVTEKVYLKMSNIKILFENKLKLLKLTEIFENLRLKFAKNLDKEMMTLNFKAEIQYIILNWIKDILFFAETNIRNYISTISEQAVIEKINNELNGIRQKINIYINAYERQILQYLLIMGKYNGIAYYYHAFQKSEFLANLISGLISAIQSFGYEIMRNKSASIKNMQYEGFNISLCYGQDILTALITTGQIIGPLNKKLEDFTNQFEKNFQEELIEFDGIVDVFKPTSTLIQKYFEI